MSNYYRADTYTVTTTVTANISKEGNYTIFAPSVPSETGIVFYPGAKVEETAYLPLLQRPRQQGYTCILVKMPFHLAVFEQSKANKVIESYPDIKDWYIAGHSLGGAMSVATPENTKILSAV